VARRFLCCTAEAAPDPGRAQNLSRCLGASRCGVLWAPGEGHGVLHKGFKLRGQIQWWPGFLASYRADPVPLNPACFGRCARPHSPASSSRLVSWPGEVGRSSMQAPPESEATGALGRGRPWPHRCSNAAHSRLLERRSAAATRAGSPLHQLLLQPDRCWRAPAPVAPVPKGLEISTAPEPWSPLLTIWPGPLSGQLQAVLQAGPHSVAPKLHVDSPQQRAVDKAHTRLSISPANTQPPVQAGAPNQRPVAVPGQEGVPTLAETVPCSRSGTPYESAVTRVFQAGRAAGRVNWATVEQVGGRLCA